MIEAVDLSKSFGAVRAVHNISFRIEPGEVVGFLGPNGAGKSTTFRMLAGTLGASSGHVLLGGVRLDENPIAAKRVLGYMPENAPLYPELTGREYLQFRSELKKIPRRHRPQAIKEASEKAGASPMLDAKIGNLSKGYRQRMALADALLGDPPILLLDEPTAGLDPNQVLDIRALVRDLAGTHTILLSTHILSEVEATCSRAIVIHEGSVVASGSLEDLKKRSRPTLALLKVRATEAQVRSCLKPLALMLSLIGKERVGGPNTSSGLPDAPATAEYGECTSMELHLKNPRTLSEAVALCALANIAVLEATPTLAPLDEVFADLTGKARSESGRGVTGVRLPGNQETK